MPSFYYRCGLIVLRKTWPSDQSDSIPDIPGKKLLPGPRKSTKATRPSHEQLSEGCGLGTRLYKRYHYGNLRNYTEIFTRAHGSQAWPA